MSIYKSENNFEALVELKQQKVIKAKPRKDLNYKWKACSWAFWLFLH